MSFLWAVLSREDASADKPVWVADVVVVAILSTTSISLSPSLRVKETFEEDIKKIATY